MITYNWTHKCDNQKQSLFICRLLNINQYSLHHAGFLSVCVCWCKVLLFGSCHEVLWQGLYEDLGNEVLAWLRKQRPKAPYSTSDSSTRCHSRPLVTEPSCTHMVDCSEEGVALFENKEQDSILLTLIIFFKPNTTKLHYSDKWRWWLCW